MAIASPVKQCGKTTLLRHHDIRLVFGRCQPPIARPAASSASSKAIGRRFLIDEADSFPERQRRAARNSQFRPSPRRRRAAQCWRRTRAAQLLHVPACAIALIGQLPGTLSDRSVPIELVRRRPNEAIEVPVRSRRPPRRLARQAVRWTKTTPSPIAAMEPEMPAGLYNREADNWRRCSPSPRSPAATGPFARARRSSSAIKAAMTSRDFKFCWSTSRKSLTRTMRTNCRHPSSSRALHKIEGRPWAEVPARATSRSARTSWPRR